MLLECNQNILINISIPFIQYQYDFKIKHYLKLIFKLFKFFKVESTFRGSNESISFLLNKIINNYYSLYFKNMYLIKKYRNKILPPNFIYFI